MIKKVIISGGREVGGLSAFSNTLAKGFKEIGIEVEVLSFKNLLMRWSDLRDENILKIYSTSAVFLTPFSKNSISVAHGFPRIDAQGYFKTFLIWFSYKLAEKFSKTVAVSYYVKTHLKACFNVKVDRVIYNPINSIFLKPEDKNYNRNYLTYIGRFHEVKNILLFIEPLKEILDKHPKYKAIFIGHGKLYYNLKEKIGNDNRFIIKNAMSQKDLKKILQQTEVFFSGCETEAFGLTYLEALSCGAKVVMPNSGGGLEIAPKLIGKKVFTYSLSQNKDDIYQVINKAIINKSSTNFNIKPFISKNIANEYISLAKGKK